MKKLTAIVATCVLLAVAGCDRLLGADRRIERAAASYEAGLYEAAMSDVKTALEAEPENIAGRILLARISLRFGDAETARKELDRAIAAGADPAAVRDLHYDILLQQNRFEDALIAAAVDEDLAPPRRLIVMAKSQAALRQYEDADRSVEQALALDANDAEARLIQARLHWAQGRPDEAKRVLNQLLERDPGHALAWLYQGRLAFDAGDAKAAEAAFTEALKTAGKRLDFPDWMAAHAGRIESRMALADQAGAEAALQDLQTLAADALVTRYLSARLAVTRGDFSTAVAELQRALSNQPDNQPARLLLSVALLGQGSSEQAEAELSRLVSDHPDNIEARKMLARVYLSRNDVAAARRVLGELPTSSAADPGVDWFAGAVLMMAGQTAEGIARLEQAAAVDPKNFDLKLDLVRAYLNSGRRGEALEVIASIPAGEGGPRRRQLTVLAEVSGLEPAPAREGVARLIRENPDDSALLTSAGLFLLNSGDAAGAIAAFRKAVAAAPQDLEARLGLAASLHHNGDTPRSREQLQMLIEQHAGDERAYVALARMAMLDGNRAEAKTLLERAVSAQPAAVEARLQLADLALAEGDIARMKSMADQALSVTGRSAAALDRVGQLLARASLFDEALSYFNEAAGKGSDDAAIHAANTLRILGRDDEARARLESLASRRRDWSLPVVHLVALDVSQERFAAALGRVKAFQDGGGAASVADELRGDVHLAAGQNRDAMAAYLRASEARPTAALAVKLYRARVAAGAAAPDASLRQWLATNPDDQMVRLLLAEYAQVQGNRKAAIAEYERAIKVSASPAALNNLAWLYYEEGNPRAEELARRAYTALPENAAIADTLGWILVEKGKVQEGLPILEKAAKAAPKHADIQYHYAVALARSGQKKEAATRIRALLDSNADFAGKRDAEALLRELAGP